VSNQPHELPRGVQGEGAGAPSQFKASLLRGPIAFAVIAAVATGHEVFPGGTSAARTGNDVIQRQFRARKNSAAELAGIAVAQQNVFAGKRAALLWNVPIG
jgi:hypothetical protein